MEDIPERSIAPEVRPEEINFELSVRPRTFNEYVGHEKIKENLKIYIQAAKQNKALVAPAGIAWDIAYKQNPKYPLHASDNSHPADLGVYLSAMVFYSTFFDAPPTDMPARINTYRNGKGKAVIVIADRTRINMEKIATEAIKTLKEIKSKPSKHN